jgi:hypothetical protein
LNSEHSANTQLFQTAQLLLSLYELRRETKLREARQWFLSSFRPETPTDFFRLCPPGSETETYFRMVSSYWELAASFVTAGIVDQDLFIHNNAELLQVWERIRCLVPAWREAWNNPLAVKNLEEVAKRTAAYMNQAHPLAHETFISKMQ